MSLARAVVPGRTYMITRRCAERRFFLRPDAESNNAFIYCLAVAAAKYGVKVIFTSMMSNHHHTGVVDVEGNLPLFLAHFHRLIAKHQNALRGRWESMWAPTQTSAVELVTPDDILAKMVYALVNPVADHVVETVEDWPGVNSLAATLADRALTATRPKRFFRRDGSMPETVSLSLHLPDELVADSKEKFLTTLQEHVSKAEQDAATKRAASGAKVVGRAAVLKQHWDGRPSDNEPRGGISPRLACRDAWRRIEALARNKVWLAAYEEARRLFATGQPAVFPAGTYWLRRVLAVPCEPASAT